MSSSELRYLIAANDLAKELQSVKQTDIANRLHVTKVSAYNAIERLREKEYIEKNELTELIKAVRKRSYGSRKGSSERVYDDYTFYVGAFVVTLRND